jgi:dihydrodipicolinate synthase/N-acetylneuraminate lyase
MKTPFKYMKPAIEMSHWGVVVPMVTPLTEDGKLDEPAVNQLVDFLLASGVDGIFVLGTTGEGLLVPRSLRRRLVECAVARVKGRVKVYAGIGDAHPDAATVGNDFFEAGVDVLVAHPPVSTSVKEILPWYQSVLDGLKGPLILYNMPSIAKVSIPLDAVERLLGHARLAGIKDSENDGKRLEELLHRFGGRPNFSIFVGVGALMEKGLKLGAVGIVPSVGNLIPDVCRRLCAAARLSEWAEVEKQFMRMNTVAAVYQRGRNLNESLAALKAAVHCLGFCRPHVLPPLQQLDHLKLDALRIEMIGLNLLNGDR